MVRRILIIVLLLASSFAFAKKRILPDWAPFEVEAMARNHLNEEEQHQLARILNGGSTAETKDYFLLKTRANPHLNFYIARMARIMNSRNRGGAFASLWFNDNYNTGHYSWEHPYYTVDNDNEGLAYRVLNGKPQFLEVREFEKRENEAYARRGMSNDADKRWAQAVLEHADEHPERAYKAVQVALHSKDPHLIAFAKQMLPKIENVYVSPRMQVLMKGTQGRNEEVIRPFGAHIAAAIDKASRMKDSPERRALFEQLDKVMNENKHLFSVDRSLRFRSGETDFIADKLNMAMASNDPHITAFVNRLLLRDTTLVSPTHLTHAAPNGQEIHDRWKSHHDLVAGAKDAKRPLLETARYSAHKMGHQGLWVCQFMMNRLANVLFRMPYSLVTLPVAGAVVAGMIVAGRDSEHWEQRERDLFVPIDEYDGDPKIRRQKLVNLAKELSNNTYNEKSFDSIRAMNPEAFDKVFKQWVNTSEVPKGELDLDAYMASRFTKRPSSIKSWNLEEMYADFLEERLRQHQESPDVKFEFLGDLLLPDSALRN